MIRRCFVLLIAAIPLCSLLLFSGCGSSNESSTTSVEVAAESPTPAAATVPASEQASPSKVFVAATQAQVEALVNSIQTAIAEQNAAAFSELIDDEQLTDRILKDLIVSAESRKELIQSMRTRDGMHSICDEIMNAVQTGGDYYFVQIVPKEDEFRPLFRMTLLNGVGLDYHELVVSQDSKGQPRIVDIEFFQNGEPMSQALRRMLLPTFVAENSAIGKSLTAVESDYISNSSTIDRMNELAGAQKSDQALRLFSTLPKSLQTDKGMLMLKLGIAQQVSNDEFVAVAQEIERAFPNDPAGNLRSRDLFVVAGKHEDAVKAIDTLMESVPDPYLGILQVDSLIALNRLDEAQKAASNARAASPNRVAAYWVEIGMQLKLKDHKATAKSLDDVADRFSIKFSDLTTIAEYSDFVASEEGMEWISRHPPEPSTGGPASVVPEVPEAPVAPAVPDAPN